VRAADGIESFLKKALRAMLGSARRPALLSVPLDIQQQPWNAEYKPLQLQGPARVMDGRAAQPIPEILAKSTHIVMYIGNGAVRSSATAAIRDFAEQYGIPVVTTLRAKGAISEDESVSFGVFGLGGSLQANKVVMGDDTLGIQSAEVLLVLGATLNENNPFGWSSQFPLKKRMVRVDISPNNMASVESGEHFIRADIHAFFAWLLGQKSRYHEPLMASKAARRALADRIRMTPYYDTHADRESDQVPIHPARVIAELRKVAPRDALVVVDSGAHTSSRLTIGRVTPPTNSCFFLQWDRWAMG
jgi:acetolactate synthase I/II/III large subunit